MALQILTPEIVREFFCYDSTSGVLTWRKARRNGSKPGDVAGPPGSMRKGYLRVQFEGRSYSVHRIAWLYANGCEPSGEVDHIDGDKTNNRIGNLRDVTRTHNQENLRLPHKDNACGLLGVCFNKKNRKFIAQITIKGHLNYLGSFDSAESAHEAYLTVKRKQHVGCTI